MSDESYERTVRKKEIIESEIERLEASTVGTTARIQEFLRAHNSTELTTGATLAELVRRPELSYEAIADIDTERPEVDETIAEQINIEIKYEDYIKRQRIQVDQFRKLEKKLIPADIDYDDVPSLRIEARQKLKKMRPASIGQASRISGVSPADINVLLVYLGRARG